MSPQEGEGGTVQRKQKLVGQWTLDVVRPSRPSVSRKLTPQEKSSSLRERKGGKKENITERQRKRS